MLSDADALATIAVKNLGTARAFYEGKLGLKPAGPESQPGVANYTSGRSRVLVYESQFAGTNKATTATWVVRDLEPLVKDLASKGVPFEHYDMPGATLQGDVHVFGEHRVAWCKDPDGNILSFVAG